MYSSGTEGSGDDSCWYVDLRCVKATTLAVDCRMPVDSSATLTTLPCVVPATFAAVSVHNRTAVGPWQVLFGAVTLTTLVKHLTAETAAARFSQQYTGDKPPCGHCCQHPGSVAANHHHHRKAPSCPISPISKCINYRVHVHEPAAPYMCAFCDFFTLMFGISRVSRQYMQR